jgi:hypothetical protein
MRIVARGAALVAAAAALAIVASAVPAHAETPGPAPQAPDGLASMCAVHRSITAPRPDDTERADALLSGSVLVATYPKQPLPDDIDWSQPALPTDNYEVWFQSLVWTDPLRREWLRTGDVRYRDRWIAILRDFAADNSDRSHPLTMWSWYDHPMGQRATVLACAAVELGLEPWLVDALEEHIEANSDPATYVGTGNHALMQNAGLLAAGTALGDDTAIALSLERTRRLLMIAVSPDGVSLEGSISYHGYNDAWWSEMLRAIDAAGQPLPDGSERIALMSRFGADMALPDGTVVNIGDGFPTDRSSYDWRDARDFAVYSPGYLVSRSSGKAGRTVLATRYGQPMKAMIHGHRDAGSLELWAFGTRMITDSGSYAYNGGFWRTWVRSPGAHSGITADGAAYLSDRGGRLVRAIRRDGYLTATFELPVLDGVTWYRTIKQSLAYGWVLVDDQVVAPASTAWVQRWQVPGDADYQVLPTRVDQISGLGAKVSVLAVGGAPRVSVRAGVGGSRLWSTAGWRSYRYEEIEPAPTVELRAYGSSWHAVTLIAPRAYGETAKTVQATDARVTASGAAVTIRTARGVSRAVITRLR